MKVMATIRETATGTVRTIEADEPSYDAGYAALEVQVSDGWQMLSVGIERD